MLIEEIFSGYKCDCASLHLQIFADSFYPKITKINNELLVLVKYSKTRHPIWINVICLILLYALSCPTMPGRAGRKKLMSHLLYRAGPGLKKVPCYGLCLDVSDGTGSVRFGPSETHWNRLLKIYSIFISHTIDAMKSSENLC